VKEVVKNSREAHEDN